jgi:cathepsin L
MQVLMHILFLAGVAINTTAVRRTLSNHTAAYEEFRLTHGRALLKASEDPISYEERLMLFRKSHDAVMRHNARGTSAWVASLNKFSDYTAAEFQMLLGHRPARREHGPSIGEMVAASSSFVEVQPSDQTQQRLATNVNWTQSLKTGASVKDQGGCGSCWAVAAVGALEMHAELLAKTAGEPLSYEQLVDCVENPNECGGQGGCRGATSELAFGHVQSRGLAFQADYRGYQHGGDGKCKPHGTKFVTSDGFERLPVNKLEPLLAAVNQGPVAVSVDASPWGMYSAGVFHGCDRHAIVNHAVVLVGYGNDATAGRKYFLIRNSWGEGWGENGYIRLNRRDTDEGEAGFCGMDARPRDGVGCKGENSPIPVCGDCGVLSDSSFPKGVRVVAASGVGHVKPSR